MGKGDDEVLRIYASILEAFIRVYQHCLFYNERYCKTIFVLMVEDELRTLTPSFGVLFICTLGICLGLGIFYQLLMQELCF